MTEGEKNKHIKITQWLKKKREGDETKAVKSTDMKDAMRVSEIKVFSRKKRLRGGKMCRESSRDACTQSL